MTQVNNPNQAGISIDFGAELSKNLEIHTNVNQEIIITTADKIKLVLINTREVMTSQRDWWTPAGLLTSFITTLCTADFKDAYGVSKDFWRAIFVLMTLFSAIWLLKTLYKLVNSWGQDDLSKIIEQIKLKSHSDQNPAPQENGSTTH